MVDQLADLFRTTHKVKTQQVVKNRGQHSGDIELAGYLANEAGPVPLVLGKIHERFGRLVTVIQGPGGAPGTRAR
jgi:hypothetical protein